jgi:branched-chain amino acid transport system permease protein
MNFASALRLWPLRLLVAVLSLALLLGLENFLPGIIGEYNSPILRYAGIAVILAVSLNLINGITGQFSLGHAGFMAIGAYVAAAFTVYAGPRLVFVDSVIFLIAILIGAVAAGIAGFLVGVPSLRLRGDYLAIVTLGFGEIIRVVIRTIKEVGGASGFSGGRQFDPGALANIPQYATFAWVYGAAALCILCVWALSDSVIGRSMRAVREDEVAAEAAGINTTRTKVTAFVVSAMWAGVAGALQAHLGQNPHPDSFGFLESVRIVVMVVLGGLGSISGAAIAAFGMRFLEEYLRDPSWAVGVMLALAVLAAALAWPKLRSRPTLNSLDYVKWAAGPLLTIAGVIYVAANYQTWLQANAPTLRYIIYAVILIVLMLLRPQGLFGRGEISWRTIGRRGKNTAVRAQLDEKA